MERLGTHTPSTGNWPEVAFVVGAGGLKETCGISTSGALPSIVLSLITRSSAQVGSAGLTKIAGVMLPGPVAQACC